jgi:antitoxin component of MazEF toxin-antitoxin module|tara:strand:- start:692 stop:880 length:189 start_codon:yes stop_codon:yes gene_type:complete
MKKEIPSMEKNREKNFSTVEVDSVTGEYVMRVPEWIVSEFGWYEGTEINMEVDGESVIITEV